MAPKSVVAWALAGAIACTAMAARADQRDPALDGMFAALHAAGAGTAPALEANIWRTWLKSGRDEVDALVATGVAAMSRADQPAALAAFDQVVAKAPEYAEGWNKRATVLYLLGRYENSIQDIGRVLALEPRHFGALSGLGLCNLALGRHEAALAAFQRAALMDPSLSGVQDNISALKRLIQKERI